MEVTFQDAILVLGLVVVCASLQGCNFSSTGEYCSGSSCDCYINFYGMDANISIGTTQIEHASRRIAVLGIANDVKNGNSSDCCLSLQELFQAQIRGVEPAPEQRQNFCQKCQKSLNAEVAAAASNCSAAPPGGSAHALRNAILQSRKLQSQKEPKVESKEAELTVTPPSSDDYVDCDVNFVGKDTNLTLNGIVLGNAQSDFRIKWTDRATSETKVCCESLKPLVTSLYVKGVLPQKADQQKFCTACKDAYNTGVAAAAYRSCATNVTNEALVSYVI